MKTCKTCQRTYSTHFANCPQDGTPLLLSDDWADGTLIRGKYKIIQKVGQGAMGAVYKALHMHFDEIRALKVIATQLSTDKTFVKRFEQEAILARRLQHPSAVRVDDIDETEDGQPFIVMEFIEGKSLRSVMNTEGPMNPQRVCAIVKQVASALDAANKLGIVHRDIKPENIILLQTTEGELAKVLDFGVAKLNNGLQGNKGASLTETGMVVGTPAYMSPEQATAAPGENLDGRSDIYSLGVVMYQMLTDELPFRGDTSLQIVMAHIQIPPIPIQEARPRLQIPDPIAALVMKCLEKKRQLRPPNGQALIDALATWELERHEKEDGPTVMTTHRQAPQRTASTPRSTVQIPAPVPSARSTQAMPAPTMAQHVATPPRSRGLLWALLAVALVASAAGAWYLRRTNYFASKQIASNAQPADQQPSAAATDPQPSPDIPDSKAESPSAQEALASKVAPSLPPAPAGNGGDISSVATPAKSSSNSGSSKGGMRASAVGSSSPYSPAEYNAYKSAQSEKDETHQIQRLDEFLSRFPDSALLPDVYALYYRDYRELKNFPKVIEYSDRLVALGDKADAHARFQALYERAIAYHAMQSNDPAQAMQARDAAAAGLSLLNELKKPANVSEEAFEAQKKPIIAYLNVTAGTASIRIKDYAGAVESYKAALALDPNDGNTTYRLGLAYFTLNPPQHLDGFWTLAHFIATKSKEDPRTQDARAYLRKTIANYQQTGCDTLVDSEVNDLLQAAASSWERPATFKLPGKADMAAARNAMTIATVMSDLGTGGDKAKVTWLAACGMQFTNVPSKVISITPGDPLILKLAFVTNELEFSTKKLANMEVTIADQPEASGLADGSLVRFNGTLASYDPKPLLLHWQDAKIHPQDVRPTSK
jgi:serine/threonine protein kinase